MRVLIATRNATKYTRLYSILRGLPYELVGLEEAAINTSVEENGRTPEENARMKAALYCGLSGLTTIADDAGLKVDRFPDHEQPGVYVRRVAGKRLEDEELFRWYQGKLEDLGGHSPACWLAGIAVAMTPSVVCSRTFFFPVQLRSNACPERDSGEPLNSLTFVPSVGKYLAQMTLAEKAILYAEQDKELRSFVASVLKEFLKSGDCMGSGGFS